MKALNNKSRTPEIEILRLLLLSKKITNVIDWCEKFHKKYSPRIENSLETMHEETRKKNQKSPKPGYKDLKTLASSKEMPSLASRSAL